MADFDDIDALLSSSLKSAAEPANSAGVADAIRSRVAAGDAGTSVEGTTAPGWTPPRPRWFVPLVSAVIGLAVITAILIGVLVVGAPAPEATPTPTPTPTPTATPTPTPTTEEQPPPPPPPPPADQTPPSLTAGGWTPRVVYGSASAPWCDTVSAISVTASDPGGVASVTASSSFPGTQATLVGSSGDTYTFQFSGAYVSGPDVAVTVTFRATDTAGNTAVITRSLTLRSSENCIVIT